MLVACGRSVVRRGFDLPFQFPRLRAPVQKPQSGLVGVHRLSGLQRRRAQSFHSDIERALQQGLGLRRLSVKARKTDPDFRNHWPNPGCLAANPSHRSGLPSSTTILLPFPAPDSRSRVPGCPWQWRNRDALRPASSYAIASPAPRTRDRPAAARVSNRLPPGAREVKLCKTRCTPPAMCIHFPPLNVLGFPGAWAPQQCADCTRPRPERPGRGLFLSRSGCLPSFFVAQSKELQGSPRAAGVAMKLCVLL